MPLFQGFNICHTQNQRAQINLTTNRFMISLIKTSAHVSRDMLAPTLLFNSALILPTTSPRTKPSPRAGGFDK